MYVIIPFIVLVAVLGVLAFVAHVVQFYTPLKNKACLKSTQQGRKTKNKNNDTRNRIKSVHHEPADDDDGEYDPYHAQFSFWFTNNTDKILNIHGRFDTAIENVIENNVLPGERRPLRSGHPSSEYKNTMKCDELAVSVYEVNPDLSQTLLYNWYPTCDLIDRVTWDARLSLDFSIEVDQPQSINNQLKITWLGHIK